MVYPELGVGLLIFSIIGFVIQVLCALYHFLEDYLSEAEFFVDGFEIVGMTFWETISELISYVALQVQRLWDILCVVTWILTVNVCPPLARAYLIVYHSEHSDTITEIIADSIATSCSLFWFHLRGDTL